MNTRTLSVLLHNRPGVVARVAALLSRRGFAVDSLAVGPGADPGLSRMTVVLDHARQSLSQIAAQVDKLVDVQEVVPLDPNVVVRRELVLVTVTLTGLAVRERLAEVLRPFHATTAQMGADAAVVQAVGTTEEIADLLRVLRGYGIRDLARSGVVALEGTARQHAVPAEERGAPARAGRLVPAGV